MGNTRVIPIISCRLHHEPPAFYECRLLHYDEPPAFYEMRVVDLAGWISTYVALSHNMGGDGFSEKEELAIHCHQITRKRKTIAGNIPTCISH
jgi:hypothetical protein